MKKTIFKTFLPLLAETLLETVVTSCEKEEKKKTDISVSDMCLPIV